MAFQDAAAPISYINCDLPVLSPPPRVPPLVGNSWLLVMCWLIASRALADCMWCVSLLNVTLPAHYLFYQLKSSLFWKKLSLITLHNYSNSLSKFSSIYPQPMIALIIDFLSSSQACFEQHLSGIFFQQPFQIFQHLPPTNGNICTAPLECTEEGELGKHIFHSFFSPANLNILVA